MSIYDWNGSASTEIGKVYDWNGSASTQIGKVYDWNGSASSLIYTAAPDPLVLYDGPNRVNLVSPQTYGNGAYYAEERNSTSLGYRYDLIPHAAGYCGAVMRSTAWHDLTDYTCLHVTYQAGTGYGDAARESPRPTIYTSASWKCAPYDDPDGAVKTSWWKEDIDVSYWRTVSVDITGVTGGQFLFVGNWSALYGASRVYVQKMWCT